LGKDRSSGIKIRRIENQEQIAMPFRALLIHQAFASKDEPGGTRHYELGRRLVAEGHSFTVITSGISYQTGQHFGIKKPESRSIEDGIVVRRVRTFAANGCGLPSRVLSFLTFMASAFVAGLSEKRPDVVIGTTPQMFQALSAWLLAVVHRRPFLLEVRDLWPDFAIDLGLLKNPILIKLLRGLENFLYRRADHLLVNSPAYRTYLLAKGIPPGRITFIANGADLEMFNPDGRGEAFRREHGLERKFVVTYAGAIGIPNNLDVLLSAAAKMRTRNDIQILIVGDGKERRRLEEQANRAQLRNLKFLPAVAKSGMREVLAASDACIGILKNIKAFRTTYPNKIFDYMAAGRPTLLAIDGVIREVVEAAGGGVFVPPGDAEALSEATCAMADQSEEAQAMGARARAYVALHFNRNEQARELAALIARVASRNHKMATGVAGTLLTGPVQ
jgi:glycosyltransferase involved in cell wall biosynthesis